VKTVLTRLINVPRSRQLSCVVCITWGQTIQKTGSSWLQTKHNKFNTITVASCYCMQYYFFTFL